VARPSPPIFGTTDRPRPLLPVQINKVRRYDLVFNPCANGQQLKCLKVVVEDGAPGALDERLTRDLQENRGATGTSHACLAHRSLAQHERAAAIGAFADATDWCALR
jgi:hypothetical protein